MKTLKMVAVSAICSAVATASFADTISSDIVGYTQKNMNIGGFTMNGNSFIGIKETQGLRLTALEPKGYEANQDLIDGEGTSGEFNIQTLTKLGATDKAYIWVRTYDVDNGEWNDDGHWQIGTTTITPGSENDVLFKAGQGLWTAAPDWADDDDAVYSFTDAGRVSTNDVKFVFNVGGFTPCANPFPVGIRLSSLIPTGYENNQDLIDGEGTSGEFNIQTLTKLGATDKAYIWVRTYDVDNGEWNDDGHWQKGTEIITPGSANDPVLDVGQGLWIAAPDYADDDGAEYSMTATYPNN